MPAVLSCMVWLDSKVSARRLVWDSLDGNGDRVALLDSSPGEDGRFDLVIASDCLFFKVRLEFFFRCLWVEGTLRLGESLFMRWDTRRGCAMLSGHYCHAVDFVCNVTFQAVATV